MIAHCRIFQRHDLHGVWVMYWHGPAGEDGVWKEVAIWPRTMFAPELKMIEKAFERGYGVKPDGIVSWPQDCAICAEAPERMRPSR